MESNEEPRREYPVGHKPKKVDYVEDAPDEWGEI